MRAATMITLGLASAAATSPIDANFRAGAHAHAQNIRAALLANYDPMVPPASDRAATGTQYSATGTDVAMQVRFFKVLAVRASEGIMQMKVWVRLQWRDDRLKWTPSSYGGLTTVRFKGQHADSMVESEIWVPDIQPYNSATGMFRSLDPSTIKVSSDGDCFYSRPGSLDVSCKFSGLVAFPRDNLTCAIEFGG